MTTILSLLLPVSPDISIRYRTRIFQLGTAVQAGAVTSQYSDKAILGMIKQGKKQKQEVKIVSALGQCPQYF